MSSLDRLNGRVLLVATGLVPLTALAIFFIYGADLFKKWPWFRFSLVMSVLTCLWAYTLGFSVLNGAKKESLNPFFYGLFIMPFNFLPMYPGTKALGIHSDENVFVLLPILAVIHGVGFFYIKKGMQQIMPVEDYAVKGPVSATP